MQLKEVKVDLKRARLKLENVKEVEILQDWRWDTLLEKWFLKISIISEIRGEISDDSMWYIVVDEDYPENEVKIYPDSRSGCKLTFEHQANNGMKAGNGLWRKGNPCLQSQLKYLERYDSGPEPKNADNRLYWHVQRLIYWIDAVNSGELAPKGEPFELPQFNEKSLFESIKSDENHEQYVFSEDGDSFNQWESIKDRFGIALLYRHEYKPYTYYFIREFKDDKNNTIHSVNWGRYLSLNFKTPIPALWILINDIPVVKYWQAPNCFEELIEACVDQEINLRETINRIISTNFDIFRDNTRHLFLLGFPIPEKIGDKNSVIHWQAFKLPKLSQANIEFSGFRDPKHPESYLQKKDKHHVLTDRMELEWLTSQNWSIEKITNRGRLFKDLILMKTFIIGAGTIGASVAELLVRGGVTDISIMDYDLLEVGNLSRYPLGLKQIGRFKALELAIHLNLSNPHVNAEKNIGVFKASNDANEELDKYDLIIDCTSEDSVLYDLEKIEFKKDKIFVSISIGIAAEKLYLSLQKGKKFKPDDFLEKISPWIKEDIDKFPEYDLPRDGANCWNPVFPARYDDIWLASCTAVKVIENFIEKDKKELNIVYRKCSNTNSIGYQKVE